MVRKKRKEEKEEEKPFRKLRGLSQLTFLFFPSCGYMVVVVVVAHFCGFKFVLEVILSELWH
jgi:hypothetical protein